MRVRGIIKVLLLSAMDFTIVYELLGFWAALIVVSIILLYGFLGEHAALYGKRAIRIDNADEFSRMNLTSSLKMLKEDAKKSGIGSIPDIKLYIIPTDEINAFSYGRNIAITQGALRVADGLTLNAILAHELCHSICLDAFWNRMAFANVTAIMLGTTVSAFVVTSFLWIVFLGMCALGLCGGVAALFCASGISKAIKGAFHLLQRMVLAIYQITMGILSKRCELRADNMACQLGYSAQLKYFLQTYMASQNAPRRSIRDALYDSHPDTYKRIARIDKNINKGVSKKSDIGFH